MFVVYLKYRAGIEYENDNFFIAFSFFEEWE